MSQDKLIKLVSSGDKKSGAGKGHIYYTRKNKKQHTDKFEFKKYNPITRKHETYKEKK